MSLKLMYITNNPSIAKIAENNGVDRIFIDLEYIGKSKRQHGMDTVKSGHTIDDVAKIRNVITNSQLLVRVNPIHSEIDGYPASKEEIDAVINNGADIVMLPYFKTVQEVKEFITYVNRRATTMLLLETPEAVDCLDEILKIEGIDEIHIGLNDLSIGYNLDFLFAPLANGTVDSIIDKIKASGIPYGFGGIASLGKGLLHSEYVIAEHYRLGSSFAILSRSFCNASEISDLKEVEHLFSVGVSDIRDFENKCKNGEIDFEKNRLFVKERVKEIMGE